MKRLLCMISGGMNTGGAETFLMKLYRELDREHYQMDFAVASDKPGFYDEEIKKMGGRLYYVPPKSKRMFRSFLTTYGIIKNNHYTYVLRTSQQSLAALDLLAAMLAGARVRVYRSSNAGSDLHGVMESMDRYLFWFMPRLFANVKIAPSTEAAEYVFGKNCISKGRAELLPNAIDTKLYRFDRCAGEAIRKELGLSDKPVIGHVGRFSTQKNHLFLLDIFSEILKTRPDCVLLLVGSGELETACRERVAELGMESSVVFAGVRSDVPGLMSAMDLMIFPSLYEGMPNVIIEAQATGLKCLISDTITPEVGVTDLVFRESLKNDSTQWANRAVELLSNQAGERTAQKTLIEAGYDIQAVVLKFTKLAFRE